MTDARGSKLQVQIYVNRRPGELTDAVMTAMPELARHAATIGWVAPLEKTRFSEPRDQEFLAAVGREDLAGELEKFWPRRGPVWDALGVAITPRDRPGVVLAEGKSYPGELRGPGTKAGPEALPQIREALAQTQEGLGLAPDPDAWLRDHYQAANRLAHTWWLRSHGVDAWFVHLFFTNDRTHGRPTTAETWETEWPRVAEEMKIGELGLEWFGHAYLPALAASELDRQPEPA